MEMLLDFIIDVFKVIGPFLLLAPIMMSELFFSPKPVAEESSWYNNGKKNRFLEKGETVPDNFRKGQLEESSWYNNGKTSRFVKIGETVPDNYIKGLLDEKDLSWYNNGKREIRMHSGQKIPDGFVKGKLTDKEKADIKAEADANRKFEAKENAKRLYKEALKSFNGISIALLSKVAKAGGKMTQEEAQYLSKILDRFSKNNYQDRDIYKKIIEKEKDRINNVDLLCKKLYLYITFWEEEKKLSLIEDYVGLGYADGHYDKDKEKIILKIIHNLNIDIQLYQKVRETFEAKHNSKQDSKPSDSNKLSLDECYKVLNSSKTDSLLVIKKNYRHLIRQYHYDSITSKDLPQDMMNFAEERVKLLNGAYERVKKAKS